MSKRRGSSVYKSGKTVTVISKEYTNKNYGYYSLEASEKRGSFVYKNKSGKIVTVTAIFNSKEYAEKNYKFKDKYYVCELSEYEMIENKTKHKDIVYDKIAYKIAQRYSL